MENKKCVICYQGPGQGNFGHSQKRHSSITKSGKDAVFRQQLSTIFLLRKFFETPQDTCIRLLKDYGNPCDWVWCCNSCSVLVDKAKCVFDHITALEKRFQALQMDLKTAVLFSKKNFPGTRLPNKSDWGPTEIVRECFKSTVQRKGSSDLIDECSTEFTEIDIKEEKIETEEYSHSFSANDLNAFNEDVNDDSEYINPALNENEERDLDLESADGLLSQSETNSIASSRPKRNCRSVKYRKYAVQDNSEDSDFAEQENLSDPHKKLHSRSRLRNNSGKQGKKSKNFFCKICVRYYITKYSLKEHITKFHNGELPISCKSCEARFITEEDLKNHNEKCHSDSSIYKFFCPKCPSIKAFKLEVYLERHCRKEHPDDFRKIFPPKRSEPRIATAEESVMCKTCGKRLAHFGSLSSHYRHFHPEINFRELFPKAEKNTCDKCNTKFDKSNELKSHYEKEHPKDFRIKYYYKTLSDGHNCQLCPFTCSRKYRLVNHIRTAHTEQSSNSDSKPPDSGNEEFFDSGGEISEDDFSETEKNQQSENSSEKNSRMPDNFEYSCEADKISEENGSQELKKSNEQLKYEKGKKNFKCQKCRRSFSTIYPLKEHYLRAHGDLPLKCSKCKVRTVNEEELKRHNEEYHNELRTFSCSHCKKSFLSKIRLKEHYRKVHPAEFSKIYPRRYARAKNVEDSVTCPECGIKVFDFKAHCKNMHREYYEKRFKNLDDKICDKCGKKFANIIQTRSHYKKEHPEDFNLRFFAPRRDHKCPHCPYTTMSKKYMETHINMHNNARPYVCDLCGETFKNSHTFQFHQRSKHYEELGLQPFKCTECGKMFTTPQYLQTHMKAHKGVFNYYCHLCNRGFAAPSFLQTHLVRHKGEKPHLCDQCGNSYRTKPQLGRHIRIVHCKEKNFPCKLCHKKFSCTSRLKRHVQGVHSDGTKPYQCKICQKQFPVRNYLYIHMRSHAKKGIVAPID